MRAGVTRSPGLEEVLRAAVDGRLFDVHTALPAKVEKYDAAEQKIDAKPLLKRAVITDDGEEISEALPVITDVPVIFPRAGGFFLSFPIQKDDHVLLVFNERSIDRFVAGGGAETDPVDIRMHDLSDAVAFVGFYPFSNALADADPDNLVLGETEGIQIHIATDKIELGEKGAAEKASIDSKVQTELKAIRDSLDSLVTTFNTHTHPYVDTPAGAAVTSPTTSPGTPPAGVGATESALVTLKE